MSKSKFPSFYVVGTAKAGTTTIWSNLKQHPAVFLVQDVKYKELGYFANDHGIKSKSDYLQFFNDAQSNQIAGEVCNSYLADPSCPQRIFDEVPSAKIIICLRDPVSRAQSLHNWMVQSGYETISDFNQALKAEENRVLSDEFKKKNPHGNYRNYLYKRSGLYHDQVKSYLDVFGEDQCLILKFDDLKSKPEAFMKSICTFLQIDAQFVFDNQVSNQGKSLRFKGLQKFLRITLPHWRDKIGLPKGIMSKPINWLLRKNMKSGNVSKPTITRELRSELIHFFKEDLQKTEKLTALDFSSWYMESIQND